MMSIGRIPNQTPIDTDAVSMPEQTQVAPPAAGISRPSGVETGAIQAEAMTEAPPAAVPSALAHRNEMAFRSGALKHQLHRQFMVLPDSMPGPASGPPGDLPGTISQSPSSPQTGPAGVPENTPRSLDPPVFQTAEEKAREDRLKDVISNVIETKKETGEDVLDNIR
jgi:hypothetical protein